MAPKINEPTAATSEKQLTEYCGEHTATAGKVAKIGATNNAIIRANV
jgi:hypothetical protein